jgi:multidrug efflux pump subunit AcrA (membrane-fusion protein)
MHLFRNIFGILFITASFLPGCKQKESAVEEEVAEHIKTSVTVVEPLRQSLTDYLQLNGNTVFQKKLVIRANITGYIIDMNWKVGDRIKSGSVFCSIRTKEQDALKNLDQQEPSLKQFQQPIKITTSGAGFITTVNYTQGDFVNEGDILATITEPSSLMLLVNVPYEYNRYVYNGRTCQVQLPDGKKINAAITLSIPVIDASSQTQQFFIHLPLNEQLPENMNLLVRIPMEEKKNVICLPLQAIQTNEIQDEFWVMKLVNDSLAIRVPITVGIQNDSLKEIMSGVAINDKIVLKGGYGLTDSSLVNIEKE